MTEAEAYEDIAMHTPINQLGANLTLDTPTLRAQALVLAHVLEMDKNELRELRQRALSTFSDGTRHGIYYSPKEEKTRRIGDKQFYMQERGVRLAALHATLKTRGE